MRFWQTIMVLCIIVALGGLFVSADAQSAAAWPYGAQQSATGATIAISAMGLFAMAAAGAMWLQLREDRARSRRHLEGIMVAAFEADALTHGAAAGSGHLDGDYVVWRAIELTQDGPSRVRLNITTKEWSGWRSAGEVPLGTVPARVEDLEPANGYW